MTLGIQLHENFLQPNEVIISESNSTLYSAKNRIKTEEKQIGTMLYQILVNITEKSGMSFFNFVFNEGTLDIAKVIFCKRENATIMVATAGV